MTGVSLNDILKLRKVQKSRPRRPVILSISPPLHSFPVQRKCVNNDWMPHIESNDWLPGPLWKEASMPLSIDELGELYAFNAVLSDEDISQLSQPLPYVGDLLTATQFSELVSEGNYLRQISNSASASGKEGAFGKRETPTSKEAEELHQRQLKFERTMAAVEDLCGTSSGRVVTNLRSAIRALSPVQYGEALSRLADLTKKTTAYRRRKALLAKLAQAAPNWAAAIDRREGIHGGRTIPGDAAAAWQWRQKQEKAG